MYHKLTKLLYALPLFFAHTVFAQGCVSSSGGYCVNLAAIAQAAGIPGLEFLPATFDFGELISNIYVFGMGLVAISALVVLVAAGVWYMSAGDNAGRAGEAKKWMGNAIFGLVLALLSWLILYTINPDFVAKPNWVQNLQKIDDVEPIDTTVRQNIRQAEQAVQQRVEQAGGTTWTRDLPVGAEGEAIAKQANTECLQQGGTPRSRPGIFTCIIAPK